MNYGNFKNLKKGDIIYKITEVGIIPLTVKSLDDSHYYLRIYLENGATIDISPKGNSKRYFFTKEEAENFIFQSETNKIKKKKLFEYEKKLNEELGLETFLIKY